MIDAISMGCAVVAILGSIGIQLAVYHKVLQEFADDTADRNTIILLIPMVWIFPMIGLLFIGVRDAWKRPPRD